MLQAIQGGGVSHIWSPIHHASFRYKFEGEKTRKLAKMETFKLRFGPQTFLGVNGARLCHSGT